ncbi:hypothetical protein JHK85_010612 [Glycine max]|nr:hypothetical protein JHK85_010612 [Glycine max]
MHSKPVSPTPMAKCTPSCHAKLAAVKERFGREILVFETSMSKSSPCTYCGEASFIHDDISSELIYSSCGGVQQFDQFDGPQGTFIHIAPVLAASTPTAKENSSWRKT